jgi:NAD-dependent dihydropyrimidine dehydrogenase PreA subunit
MTYIIAEPRIDIKDRSCVDVGPVDCIHEFERILIIDPEECIGLRVCEPECPVEAIFPEDTLPDKVMLGISGRRARRGRHAAHQPSGVRPSQQCREGGLR